MRSLRSRPADDRTAALARARVAHLAGSTRRGLDGNAAVAAGVEDGGPSSAARHEGRTDELANDGRRPRHATSRPRRAARPPVDAVDSGGPAAWFDPAPADRLDPDPQTEPGRGPELGPEQHGPAAPWDEPASAQAIEDDAARSPEWLDGLKDRLPFAVRPRAGLERTHLAVIVLVVLVGLISATVLFLLARPEVVPIEPELVATGSHTATETPPPSDPTPAPTESAAPGPAAPDAAIVVHVAGLVARPGVLELPAGSRVVDAIEAAGGATPEADLTPINLARVLTDGEQVLVTADPPPQAAPPAAPPGSTAPAPTAPVNLNTATGTELETLPGIGPALAGRILEWRTQNGRFTTVGELREVSGIGEQRFAQLEPLVTV
ncbi:ComEA family DNA-binding protein [Jiangella mangrovi]|uniref:Competence protein ComEA n=1 Tax=Jiangella mangrovi TaxID=1524084 RepID=A0A7W9GYH3_9ACTN|nr:ComEA family DNA-binding protein [Jiangella mangrovi]MBB5791991.1 competence protein ComEA [Jiangella mangrovi]